MELKFNSAGKPACLIAVLLIVILLCGCGSSSELSDAVPDLQWPPEGEALRQVSDDVVGLLGREYSSCGGSVTVDVDTLLMDGSGDLPWAVYSVSGLSELREVGRVEFDFSVFGDGRLFAGLSNYREDSWEWYVLSPAISSVTLDNPEDYRSEDGNCHIALVLNGNANASIFELFVIRQGEEELPPPLNLYATPDVGSILLDWDEVPGAVGYYVYRAYLQDLSDMARVSDELATTNAYLVEPAATGRIHYYQVTTMGALESEPSETLAVYAPMSDLPVPQNVRVTAADCDSCRIEWDWADADPSSFIIYYKGEPDFDLNIPIMWLTAPGFTRMTNITGLTPGYPCYCRIAARDSSGKEGRMTDALLVFGDDLWCWDDTEDVGPGTGPVRVVAAEGDLTCAYFFNNDVYAARRDTGSWDPGTVNLGTAQVSGGFGLHLDLAFTGNQYIVGTHSLEPGDFWVSTGLPGQPWLAERVDGDGSTGEEHGISGYCCQVAGDHNRLVAAHIGQTDGLLIAHEKAIPEGAWQRLSVATGVSASQGVSLESADGNHYLMYYSAADGRLQIADYTGGWVLSEIIPWLPFAGEYCDLNRLNGEWITPAYNAIDGDFCVLHNGDSWSVKVADERDSGTAGKHARLATGDGQAMTIYKSSVPSGWYFGRLDGDTWRVQKLMLPDERMGTGPDIAILNGNPFVLFEDKVDGLIKAAKGVPPA
jgi:hypothetical protein